MRKAVLTFLGVAVLAALSVVVPGPATTAFAANPHLLSSPTCTSNGTSVTCSGGSVAGLGNQAVTVQASVPAGCETKPGNNEPPGHIQFQSQPIQPRNGRINLPSFTLSPDCPPGLTPVIGTSVTYTIVNESGQTLFTSTVPVTT